MVWWLQQHRTAVEYEFLVRGRACRDLGTPALNWHDAYILLKHAPMGGPFKSAVQGLNEGITQDSLLLQAAANLLQGISYQLSNGKGKKPKPIDITGQGDKNKETVKEDWGQGTSIEEMRKRLGL